MQIKILIIAYLTALVVLVSVDALWLFLTKSLYANYIGHLLSGAVRWFPVVLFYLLYAMGVLFIVVIPLVERGASIQKIAIMGALFGLVAYGTYDLTNWATLKNWPPIIVGIDLFWGACITALVSISSALAARFFG